MRRNFWITLLTFLVPVVSAAGADILLGSGVTVAPGEWATMPVTLTAPAPLGGVYVSLASSDPSVATINPALVLIRSGDTAPARQPQMSGNNFGSATVSASASGLVGSSQTVRVAASLLGPPSLQVQRATTQNVTLVLSSPSPVALTLAVSSDNPGIASVQASATIPANGIAVSIPVTGTGVGSTVIHAGALPAVAQKDLNVTVVAPGTITVPSTLTVPLGTSVPFPVTLGTPAPPSGLTVSLNSSDVAKATVAPASVFVAPGATTPAIPAQVTGVDIGLATITATSPGFATASSTIDVSATLSFSPTSLVITGSAPQRLVLVLSASAPWVTGLTAQLRSDNPNVAAVVPSVNFFPDGSAFTSVIVLITPVGPGTTIIRASDPPFIAETIATVTVVGGSGGAPASITATGGTPQTAALNTAFGLPLSATVRDIGGNPVAGATVQFQAPSLTPTGSFAGGVNTAVTNPQGVATSAVFTANGVAGSYFVTASVSGVAAPASFTLTNAPPSSGVIILPSNVTTGPGQAASFPVSLSTAAPPGGVTITLAGSDTSKATVAPATVFVAGGSTAPAFQPVVTGVNFGAVTISASANGYTSASQQVTVGGTLAFQPAAVTIPASTALSLNLTLSAPAPAGGLAVALSSNNLAVATVPSSILIPAGSTSAAVPVTGGGAGLATITAHSSAPFVVDGTARVTVAAGTDITLASGVIVAPGEWAAMPVTLTAPAPLGGVYVSLASSDPSVATISPSLVLIRSGDTAPARQPQMSGNNFGSATVSASASGLVGSSQTVRVAASLLGPPSLQVQRATTQNVTLVLSSPSPVALTLTVSSDNPGIASVPASATIPANGIAVSIPVTGTGAGSTVVHVSALPAVAQKDLNVTVVAPGTITVPSTLTVPLGTSVPFPVTLGTPAPPSGLTVTLNSSDVSKATVAPASVFVAPGATTPAIPAQVTGVDIGLATISATSPGFSPASSTIDVSATLLFSPASLVIRRSAPQRLVLVLSASAPWVTGLTARLSSDNPNVAAVVPSVNFFPDGSAFTSVVVLITPVGPGTTIIRASDPPFIAETIATITVIP